MSSLPRLLDYVSLRLSHLPCTTPLALSRMFAERSVRGGRREGAVIPALLPPPLGGFCDDTDTRDSQAENRTQEDGFLTPDQRSPELSRDAGARTRVPALWSSRSFSRLIRGGIGTRSRDWTGGLDSTGNSTTSGTARSLSSIAGSGAAGQDTPAKGSRSRVFASIPSPSHLRRSMSFAGSISAISRSASRVATGMMTPVRRRRQRREEMNGGGENNERNDGIGSRGGRGRGCGRHSIRPTNISEVYDSPGQTGGVSPEDDSPLQVDPCSSEATGLAGKAVLTEHKFRVATGEEPRHESSRERRVGSDTKRTGGTSVRVSENGGQSTSGTSPKRRSKSRDQRKLSSPRVVTSAGKGKSDREEETKGVMEWSWEEQEEGAGEEDGQNRTRTAQQDGRTTGKGKITGRPASHEGARSMYCRFYCCWWV